MFFQMAIMFSTITTVASTIMPMLMAKPPSDIRFAERPEYHIKMKATSIPNGIAAAVISELRKLPSSNKQNQEHQRFTFDH